MSLHELNTFPGVTAQPDTATANFVFNHTMLRVKDITKSLASGDPGFLRAFRRNSDRALRGCIPCVAGADSGSDHEYH